MAGKGSRRRPKKVDDKTFQDNWDRIFGKKEKSTDKHVEPDTKIVDEKNI